MGCALENMLCSSGINIPQSTQQFKNSTNYTHTYIYTYTEYEAAFVYVTGDCFSQHIGRHP